MPCLTTSEPYLRASRTISSSPARSAPIWAWMSPSTYCGVRVLFLMISTSSAFSTPPRASISGGSRRPSPPTWTSRLPPEVGPVRAADRERQQLIVVEHGHRERDVGDVRAAAVRVVEQDDVVRAQIAQVVTLERRLRAELHRRDVDGTVRGLADQLHVRIEDRVGVVDHVVDDGRERGLLEHLAHALRGVLEAASEHLERHGVELATGCGHGGHAGTSSEVMSTFS